MTKININKIADQALNFWYYEWLKIQLLTRRKKEHLTIKKNARLILFRIRYEKIWQQCAVKVSCLKLLAFDELIIKDS
jgi:hypothetical protein